MQVVCDEDDRAELLQCRIPKLTLQPIVENSIVHGVERKIGRGNLRIKIEGTAKRLIITVSDDGLGMTIARGIAQIANNNYNTDSIGEGAETFRNFFYYGKILGLYNTIWIAVVLWLIFNFLLSRTRTGRHIYAIGSNLEASKLSGVNIIRTTNNAYLVSAICACAVGLIICATSGMRLAKR